MNKLLTQARLRRALVDDEYRAALIELNRALCNLTTIEGRDRAAAQHYRLSKREDRNKSKPYYND